MDPISQLARLLPPFAAIVLLAVSCVSHPAHAQSGPIAATVQTQAASIQYQARDSGFSSSWAQDQASACAGFPGASEVGVSVNAASLTFHQMVYSGSTCVAYFSYLPPYNTYPDYGLVIGIFNQQSCPSGWTGPSGGQCSKLVCPAGYVGPDGSGMCQPQAPCPSGQAEGAWLSNNASPTTTLCDPNSCLVVGQAGRQIQFSASGPTFTQMTGQTTGAHCTVSTGTPSLGGLAPVSSANGQPTGTATSSDTNAEANCINSGMTYGTVNGVGSCQALGTNSNSTQSSSTAPTTQQQVTNNAGGGSTVTNTATQTTTACDTNGVCTTQQVVTTTTQNCSGSNGSGTCTAASSGTSTKGGPPGPGGSGGTSGGTGGTGTCQVGDPNCGAGGWGGNCQAGFSCDGDAVQCAIAQELWQQQCKVMNPSNNLLNDTDALSYLGTLAGDQAGAGAGSVVRSAIHANTSTVDAAAGAAWDQSTFYSAQCPSGAITFGGFSVTVPLDGVCSNIGGIGNVLVALTAVGCFLIYARILGGA